MSRALPLGGQPLLFGRAGFLLHASLFVLPLLFAAAFGPTRALAADPPPSDAVLHAAVSAPPTMCTDDGRVDPYLVRSFEYRLDMLRLGLTDPPDVIPGHVRGLPTTGEVKTFALLIDFADWKGKNHPMAVWDVLFGDGTDPAEYPYESLHNYYQRSSYGLLDISGNVLGWYHHDGDRDAIPRTTAGLQALMTEAIQAYDPLVDFAQYDNDHDGLIDYFIVYWAGPDEGMGSVWWGFKTGWDNSLGAVTVDGVKLDTYSWQAECVYEPGYNPLVDNSVRTTDGLFDQNVVMHETGHALGLPDYYGPTGGVGRIDMMHSGIGDHNCFSKWLLGWLTPTPISWVTRTQVLRPSGTSPTAYVVWPDAPGDPYHEFFMVQNRARVGNDSPCASPRFREMPGDGLLIWHVAATTTPDGLDFVYRNTREGTKLLKLMEADGQEHIETTYETDIPPRGWAQADDYYVAGSTFGPTTTPSSTSYQDTPTGVEVKNIRKPLSISLMFPESLQATLVGGYDHTPPATGASGWDAEWHDSGVNVHFAASDTGGSGLLRTEFSTDMAQTWAVGTSTTVAAPGTGANDGQHWIFFRSLDRAENVEVAKACYVRIDTIPPVTTAKAPSGWRNADVTVRLTATDKGAGVESTVYWMTGGPWGVGTEATVEVDSASHTMDGVHTLNFCSLDAVGRWESPKTVKVRVDTRRPTVRAPSAASCAMGGTATLLYKVVDARPSCGRAHVTIKIKDSGGTLVKKLVLRSKPVNKLLKASFACGLRRGTYRFYVSAKDVAGNASLRSATNTLKVN
jgi:M6 family metalloprotease-like protein